MDTGIWFWRRRLRRVVAQCPDSDVARHGKRRIHDHRAAIIFPYGQRLAQRIWRGSGCPYQRLGGNFRIVEQNHAGARVGHSGIQAELNATRFHAALRVTAKRLA